MAKRRKGNSLIVVPPAPIDLRVAPDMLSRGIEAVKVAEGVVPTNLIIDLQMKPGTFKFKKRKAPLPPLGGKGPGDGGS